MKFIDVGPTYYASFARSCARVSATRITINYDLGV